MKRTGTSAYAIELPQSRSTAVVTVLDRQRITRTGIFFTVIGKWRRSAYQQFDGSTELADMCVCVVDWEPDFTVTRVPGCPIDQHRIKAFGGESAA